MFNSVIASMCFVKTSGSTESGFTGVTDCATRISRCMLAAELSLKTSLAATVFLVDPLRVNILVANKLASSCCLRCIVAKAPVPTLILFSKPDCSLSKLFLLFVGHCKLSLICASLGVAGSIFSSVSPAERREKEKVSLIHWKFVCFQTNALLRSV